MSAITINFLSQYRKKLGKQEVEDRKWYRISLGFTGVIVVLMVGLLSSRVGLTVAFNRVSAQEDDLEQAVLFQEDVEKSALIVSSKLNALSELLKQRLDKQEAINYFTNLFGPNVLIKDINYEADIGILSLRIESNDVFELERVYLLLESDQTKGRFEEVNKSDLSRDATGRYGINATMVLKTEDSEEGAN